MTIPNIREIKESPLLQGEDETIVYTLSTTPLGGSPTAVTVTLYSISDTGVRTDVSATCLSGAPAVAGDVITLPAVTGLTAGAEYRLEIQFTSGASTYEPYAVIFGEH